MAGGVKNITLSAQRHGRRFFLFSLIGAINTGVDFTVYIAAVILGVAPAAANIIAFLVANPLSYVVNGHVTFRQNAAPAPLSLAAYGKFLTAHLFSLAISTALIVFLTPYMGPFFSKAAAIAVTVLINYSASAFLVFKGGDSKRTERAESP